MTSTKNQPLPCEHKASLTLRVDPANDSSLGATHAIALGLIRGPTPKFRRQLLSIRRPHFALGFTYQLKGNPSSLLDNKERSRSST